MKLIDNIDLESIQGQAQEIDRLRNARNIQTMKPKKAIKKKKKNKWIKMKENCDCGNKIMTNKQWTNNNDVQQEEKWLADSGATVHVTNSEKYLFNKMKGRSTIVVGSRKETKALAQGDVIIHHPNNDQLIKLKDVLLVTEFKQNIMSISALMSNNFHIQASENEFEIVQKNNTISLEKDEEKNMFCGTGNRIPREQINAYSKDKKVRMDINHAHDIFNHMSEQVETDRQSAQHKFNQKVTSMSRMFICKGKKEKDYESNKYESNDSR